MNTVNNYLKAIKRLHLKFFSLSVIINQNVSF